MLREIYIGSVCSAVSLAILAALLVLSPAAAHYIPNLPTHAHAGPNEDTEDPHNYHRDMLEILGYPEDLEPAQMQALLAPFDLHTDPERNRLHANIRADFQADGATRFDSQSGRILVRIDDEKSRPMTRLEVLFILHTKDLHRKHNALERISLHSLGGPSKLSTQDREIIRLMARLEEAQLPHNLIQAIRTSQAAEGLRWISPLFPQGPQFLAPALEVAADYATRKNALEAYVKSRNYFDQHRSFQDLVNSALPLTREHLSLLQRPAYFNETEKRSGKLLAHALQERLGRDPDGRDLLSRFKGLMPAFTIISIQKELGGGKYGLPLAFYNPSSHSITMLHDVLYPKIQRAALKLHIPLPIVDAWKNNPQRLIEFLAISDENDPRAQQAAELRRLIIRVQEVTLAHELTHAWQRLRDPGMAEGMRGNITQTLVNYEFEAHVNQFRRLKHIIEEALEKGEDISAIRYDPDSDLYLYEHFLSNTERFFQIIAARYRTAPQGDSNFSRVAANQRLRAMLTGLDLWISLHKLPKESSQALQQSLRHALILSGIHQGNRALARANSEHEYFMWDFFGPGGPYKSMRPEGARDLGRLLMHSDPSRSYDWLMFAHRHGPDDASRKQVAKFLAQLQPVADNWLMNKYTLNEIPLYDKLYRPSDPVDLSDPIAYPNGRHTRLFAQSLATNFKTLVKTLSISDTDLPAFWWYYIRGIPNTTWIAQDVNEGNPAGGYYLRSHQELRQFFAPRAYEELDSALRNKGIWPSSF